MFLKERREDTNWQKEEERKPKAKQLRKEIAKEENINQNSNAILYYRIHCYKKKSVSFLSTSSPSSLVTVISCLSLSFSLLIIDRILFIIIYSSDQSNISTPFSIKSSRSPTMPSTLNHYFHSSRTSKTSKNDYTSRQFKEKPHCPGQQTKVWEQGGEGEMSQGSLTGNTTTRKIDLLKGKAYRKRRILSNKKVARRVE